MGVISGYLHAGCKRAPLQNSKLREPYQSTKMKKYIAEFIGTFWFVFGGCGSAVLAAMFLTPGDSPVQLGIGFFGVSLAFGLTVLTVAYAISRISCCRLNPAVTVGLVVRGRRPIAEMIPYIVTRVAGGIAGAAVLYLIASGMPGFTTADEFLSNGFGEHSPGGYPMVSALVAEIVLTFFFLLIILGATGKRVPQGLAPLVIGLGLALIQRIRTPLTNLSVNPARGTGPAIFVSGWVITQLWLFWALGLASKDEAIVSGWAISQVWLFWAAPIIAAALAGIVYPFISGKKKDA